MTKEMKAIIDQLKDQILKEYPKCIFASIRMEAGTVTMEVSERESV